MHEVLESIEELVHEGSPFLRKGHEMLIAETRSYDWECSVHGYNFAVSGLNEIELDLEVDGAGD